MKKILVADDEPAIADALHMILEIAGYEVETTIESGVVGRIQKNRPDLVILDIWMSGVDGRGICKKIKATQGIKEIPVIMISASREIEKSAKYSGADDFLAKPFETNKLLSVVAKHMK